GIDCAWRGSCRPAGILGLSGRQRMRPPAEAAGAASRSEDNDVIPSSAARKTPYPLDRKAYRRRNVIERLFCRLKNWRRIATRYDRLASNYLSAIALVATLIAWI